MVQAKFAKAGPSQGSCLLSGLHSDVVTPVGARGAALRGGLVRVSIGRVAEHL